MWTLHPQTHERALGQYRTGLANTHRSGVQGVLSKWTTVAGGGEVKEGKMALFEGGGMRGRDDDPPHPAYWAKYHLTEQQGKAVQEVLRRYLDELFALK